MRSLADLSADSLTQARQSAETLLSDACRPYVPGHLLPLLLGRFRDEAREALGMEPLGDMPRRGMVARPADDLGPAELDTLHRAALLLNGFEGYMDDPGLPDLLREFANDIAAVKASRASAARTAGASASRPAR